MAKPKPDLSEFKELSTPSPRGCRIQEGIEFIAERSPDEAAALQAALEMPMEEISHVAIHLWLKKRDFHVSAMTVGKHRKGSCPCGR